MRVCNRCHKDIEKGDKYKWVIRGEDRNNYHASCWQDYLDFLDRFLEETMSKEPVDERERCQNGHIRTEDNTYLYEQKNGWTQKHCKDCQKDRKRKKKAKSLGSIYW